MNSDLLIDIENSAGQKQGGGPITSASQWSYTARMTATGDFAFTMPASDPKAVIVTRKRIARAYALLNGQRVEVGAGIIDVIERTVGEDGIVLLQVSGQDLIRELNYRSVLNLKLYTGGNPVTHAAAVAALGPYLPAGWSISADGAPPNNNIYGYFNGESVLAAVVKIAEKSQNQFYRGTGRALIYGSSWSVSGIRAIQAAGDLAPNTCAITSLTQSTDTTDLITRIYPRGSGNADVQLTLKPSTRTMPAGYTIDRVNNFIESTAATASYGRIERQVDFAEIGPIANTAGDIISAANMLADAALETLKRLSSELENAVYTVALSGCSALLRPLQSLLVVYRDPVAGLNINATLNILEATWSVGEDGVYTTGIRVSTGDFWPANDRTAIIQDVAGGKVYKALPQLNANSYVTAYNKNVDKDNIAGFRFRLGGEITQLQQVWYEFQLLPFESTVKSVGGSSGGSGDIPTGGPNTDTTGSGGNNETSVSGATTTGATAVDAAATAVNTAGTAVNTAGSDVDVLSAGGGDTSQTFTDTLSTGGTTTGTALQTGTNFGGGSTDADGGQSVTTPQSTSGITSTNTNTALLNTAPGGNDTQGTAIFTNNNSTGTETGSPTGGDTVTAGRHQHAIHVVPGAGNLGNVTFHDFGGGIYGFAVGVLAITRDVITMESGSHTHDVSPHTHPVVAHTHTVSAHSHTIADHTHTIGAHSHTVVAHTHTIGGHTHTIQDHTHGLPTHSHPVALHTHQMSAHTHSVAGHTHTVAAHTHSTASHTHTSAAHTHTTAAHTHTTAAHSHSLSQHTHSLNNHSHSLVESITAIYGIFRDSAANTYGLSDLQYRVNGGSWVALSTATAVAGGWYRLDITAAVADAATLRPAQENNLLEVGPVSSVVDKRANIDAQLSVRNTIQAIVYVN